MLKITLYAMTAINNKGSIDVLTPSNWSSFVLASGADKKFQWHGQIAWLRELQL